jgi:hypothetical protein
LRETECVTRETLSSLRENILFLRERVTDKRTRTVKPQALTPPYFLIDDYGSTYIVQMLKNINKVEDVNQLPS